MAFIETKKKSLRYSIYLFRGGEWKLNLVTSKKKIEKPWFSKSMGHLVRIELSKNGYGKLSSNPGSSCLDFI